MKRNIFREDNIDLLNLANQLLKKQIDLMFPRELETLKKFGVRNDSLKVLNIGCGNAAYLVSLAKEFPDFQFTGLEENPVMVEIANDIVKSSGIKTINIKRAPIFDYNSHKKYDLIITRATLQYFPDKLEDYFKNTNQLLVQGGKLVVMETDDSVGIIYPDSKIMYKLVESYNKIIKGMGVDPQIGRKIPEHMENIGMTGIEFKPLLINNYDTGKDRYLDALRTSAIFLKRMDMTVFNDYDLTELDKELERLKNTKGFIMTMPQMITKGIKS